MPLGHVSLPTTPSTYKPMRDFYLAALAPLGYTIFKEQEGVFLGLQARHNPDFWLHCCPEGGDDDKSMPLLDTSLTAEENRVKLLKGKGRTHVAFGVGSRGVVDRWFEGAVKAGGIPNGAPGERPEYTKGYYAAFVLDPLGNNVEAVFFCPWWMKIMQAAPTVLTVLFGAVAGHFAMGYAKGAGWV